MYFFFSRHDVAPVSTKLSYLSTCAHIQSMIKTQGQSTFVLGLSLINSHLNTLTCGYM